MERRLLVGAGGSGKTDVLWQNYRDLALEHKTDSILVLLWNARDVRDWRERVDLPWAGPIHVFTYFGWVQRELRRNWSIVRSKLGGQWLEPEFLTVETGQFALVRHISQVQVDFAELVTSPERLAIQLGSCLVLASLNGIPREEIGDRLSKAMPEKSPKVFQAAQRVLNNYTSELLGHGVLDYGMAVAQYRELLALPEYRRQLQDFKHLLVDDTGEQSPAAHEFMELMLEYAETGILTFSTDGGHAGFFGADPQGAWLRFRDIGPVSLIRSSKGQNLAASGAVNKNITMVQDRYSPGPKVEMIYEDLRSELLDQVAARVVRLVQGGVAAKDIAVIAPLADKVLEHTLETKLKDAGVPLNILTKNKRLIDEPYVRAMMTIGILAHPHWELDWGVPDLAQSLELLLKIDPVRSWLLSRQVKDGILLPLDMWQRERVGFRAAKGYDVLREWLDEYKNGSPDPVDVFFQRVFGELLSRLPPSRDDLVVCRQLIVSAGKFVHTQARYPSLGQQEAFISMLSAGTVAAESLLEPATREQAVVLATPYAYISGHHKSRVQVWMDCTSSRWFPGDAREIINPHVLKANWPEDEVWTDEHNQAVSLSNGARVARALLRRCDERVIITAANIDSMGFEQNSPLLEALLATLQGEGDNDAL